MKCISSAGTALGEWSKVRRFEFRLVLSWNLCGKILDRGVNMEFFWWTYYSCWSDVYIRKKNYTLIANTGISNKLLLLKRFKKNIFHNFFMRFLFMATYSKTTFRKNIRILLHAKEKVFTYFCFTISSCNNLSLIKEYNKIKK